MLHGDCFARYGDSVDVYKQSFDQHRASRSIFGYLDHPFSPRYQYGWATEDARIAAHRELVAHIANCPNVWWASTSDVLDFLLKRDGAQISVNAEKLVAQNIADDGLPRLCVRWKGRDHAI